MVFFRNIKIDELAQVFSISYAAAKKRIERAAAELERLFSLKIF